MTTVEPREVDFAVIAEDYSRYMLKDGSIIKAKIVLKKIFFSPIMTPEGYPQGVGFDTMNSVAAIVPVALKKKASDQPLDISKDRGTEVKFDEQDVKTQEYMTTNGFRVSIKPVLTKVFRYDKYNNYGEPIYNVVLQSITNVDKIESTGIRFSNIT